ncbi:MAG: hypothetical protein BWK75_04495 [Candidatus Altiarchaeales archaeon A3]|nr:MAG: hypothetical protein BWK75_04495 [Candidatus Altiarchaeales archaeon A3]
MKYYKTVIILAIVVFVAIAIIIQTNFINKSGDNDKINADILQKLKTFDELKNYENYSAEITKLTQENITKLAEYQSAIYNGLEGDIYRITYKKDNNGLLIIYDYNESKILRMFEIKNLKL